MSLSAISDIRTLKARRQEELWKNLVKCYDKSIALYGAETWTLRAVDQKHLECLEMWCWRRMEMIS
jgi:hypothetical protein